MSSDCLLERGYRVFLGLASLQWVTDTSWVAHSLRLERLCLVNLSGFTSSRRVLLNHFLSLSIALLVPFLISPNYRPSAVVLPTHQQPSRTPSQSSAHQHERTQNHTSPDKQAHLGKPLLGPFGIDPLSPLLRSPHCRGAEPWFLGFGTSIYRKCNIAMHVPFVHHTFPLPSLCSAVIALLHIQ